MMPPPTAGTPEASPRRQAERHALAALLPFLPAPGETTVLAGPPADPALLERLITRPGVWLAGFDPRRVRCGIDSADPPPPCDLLIDPDHLPWRSEALAAVVGLDLFARLRRPARFLAEVDRCLRPGGRLAVVEPWPTPLNALHYRGRRRVRLSPGLDPWFAATPERGFTAGTGVTCLYRQPDERTRHAPTLTLTVCEPFGGPSDRWGGRTDRWLAREDRWPHWLRRLVGTRVLLVLEKSPAP